MKNKAIGFYLSIPAALIMLIGLPFYAKSAYSISSVYVLTVLVAAFVAVSAFTKGEISNVLCTVGAVISAAAFICSASTQIDAIGYVLSGLFTFGQIQGFVTYAIMALIGWVLLVVASFIGTAKKA